MDLKGKKILVTGADGFVGSYLVESLLNQGADVTILIKEEVQKIKHLTSKIKIIQADLSSLNIKLENFEIVYHLAAITDLKFCLEHPEEAYKNNVLGTINLLKSLGNIQKFIYISTLGVYGESRKLPVNEESLTIPIEPYSASKLSSELFVSTFCRSRKISFVIARLFNVYGPRQNTGFVIPTIILQALKKEEITLKNLDSTRDFIFVEDAVQAFIGLSNSKNDGIYNVGTGKETSIKELVKTIEKLINKKMRLNLIPEETKSVSRSVSDITKIKKEIGWTPQTSFLEGIKRTLEYYKNGI